VRESLLNPTYRLISDFSLPDRSALLLVGAGGFVLIDFVKPISTSINPPVPPISIRLPPVGYANAEKISNRFYRLLD
jgi:hypothetical protein